MPEGNDRSKSLARELRGGHSGERGRGILGEQGEARQAGLGETGSRGIGHVGRENFDQCDRGAMAGCWIGEQRDEGVWQEEESGLGGQSGLLRNSPWLLVLR